MCTAAQYGQLLPEGTPPAPLGMAFRSVLNILIRLVEPHMQAVIQLQEAKHHEDKRGSVPSGDSNSLEDLEHVAVQTRRRLGETLCTSEHLLLHDPAITTANKSLDQVSVAKPCSTVSSSTPKQSCAPVHQSTLCNGKCPSASSVHLLNMLLLA